jgi:RHS repeat-associated protein
MRAVQIQSSMSGNIDILSGLWLDDWFASADSTGSVALLENALGSTIALVNSAGSLATQDTYEPFGKTSAGGASTTNPYAFAGRGLDPSGLYFMRARYYNPLLSRFISSDPAGGSGFLYANDDPIKLIDLLGAYAFSAFGNTVDLELSATLGFVNLGTAGTTIVFPPSIGAGVDITINGPYSYQTTGIAPFIGVNRNLSVGFPLVTQRGVPGIQPQGVTISPGVPIVESGEPLGVSLPPGMFRQILKDLQKLTSGPITPQGLQLPGVSEGADSPAAVQT